MPQSIHILSDETINQIAAGEVIESPASVIKELVENSMDAQATKIVVEIVGGGLKTIRVTDDGIGMGREDARLSIVRHATSKIQKPQDLFHISTKGFRGEALASIAAISKLTISTAREGNSGIFLDIEKGTIVEEKEIARSHGTTFEVRSLFYTVPARKKFQKSAPAITAEIFRLMTVLSLSHPDIGFEFFSNGKLTLKALSGQNFAERAEHILGSDFTQGSFLLEFREGPLHFHGIIGSPSASKINKMGQYLFLNKRAITCEVISDAVHEGYATRLDERRHPTFALHVNVPSDLIDVNVHPQKLHVRLRKEELFKEKIKEAVEKALGQEVRTFVKSNFTNIERIPIDFEIKAQTFREEPIGEQPVFELPSPIEILGQKEGFIFIDDPKFEGIVILDSRAAASRILFENLINKEESESAAQRLLIPFSLDFTPLETAMLLTHQAAIEEFGFSLRPIGKDIFMVESMPTFITESEVKDLLSSMAQNLQEFIGKKEYDKQRKEKLSSVAVRFAKSKKVYTKEEAKHLYERLCTCKDALHSPKGEKTFLHLSHDNLEHLFRTP